MTTFLFWNLNGKSLEENIARLAIRHDVDILILAENTIPSGQILKELNEGNRTQYHFPFSLCEKVTIFTRFSRSFTKPEFESSRLTIRSIALPGLTQILLAAVHLPSKLYWSVESQSLECVEIANIIRDVEREVGHRRTVLVGDLNLNPFDSGIIAANGFNAVMTKQIALRRERTIQGRRYPYFYNPMWGHFGDKAEGPAGTYYYERAEHNLFFWNIFDQVLIRPDLIHFFNNDDLTILTDDGVVSFLSDREVVNVSQASDHLPIVFKLSL